MTRYRFSDCRSCQSEKFPVTTEFLRGWDSVVPEPAQRLRLAVQLANWKLIQLSGFLINGGEI